MGKDWIVPIVASFWRAFTVIWICVFSMVHTSSVLMTVHACMHICVWVGSQITALSGLPCRCGERVPPFMNEPSQDTTSLFLDSKYQSEECIAYPSSLWYFVTWLFKGWHINRSLGFQSEERRDKGPVCLGYHLIWMMEMVLPELRYHSASYKR